MNLSADFTQYLPWLWGFPWSVTLQLTYPCIVKYLFYTWVEWGSGLQDDLPNSPMPCCVPLTIIVWQTRPLAMCIQFFLDTGYFLLLQKKKKHTSFISICKFDPREIRKQIFLLMPQSPEAMKWTLVFLQPCILKALFVFAESQAQSCRLMYYCGILFFFFFF